MTEAELEILNFIFKAARHTPPLRFRGFENQVAVSSLIKSGHIENRDGLFYLTALGRKAVDE